MDIIKLVIIFSCIIVVMKFNKPLHLSISVGIVATIILYKINLVKSIELMGLATFSKDTIYLVLAFYSITFLQRMLEKRGHIMLAEKSLSNLFDSRRVNAMVAPFIIGLLPSPGAVLIAAPIVNNAGGNYITKEEKTFVTSYFRHISELFLPTYSSILLALNLAHIDMTAFVLGMLPMVVVLFLLGYFFYVRKIPKETGIPKSNDNPQDIKNLIISLWSIVLTISIILVFKIPVHLAVIPVIILSIFFNKFSFKEIRPMFKSAFEAKMIFITVVIMMFKQIITYSGVIQRLPIYFSLLPISPAIIFTLIFFLGTFLAGSQAIIALAMPIAFATVPNGGLGLMLCLMCMTYIASQVSPTHICLAIVTEEYGVQFKDLVKKTMPIVISFVLISSLYSYLVFLVFEL